MHGLVKPTKSVFVPILACDLESLTERMLSQAQASEMNFREEFWEKLRSCQICKAVHVEVEPIPQIGKSQRSETRDRLRQRPRETRRVCFVS